MGGKSSGSSGSQIMQQPSPYETALANIANEMFSKTSKLRDYSTSDLENFMNGGSFQGGNTGLGGYPTSTPTSYGNQYALGGGNSSVGKPSNNNWYVSKDGHNYYTGEQVKPFNQFTSFEDMLNGGQLGGDKTLAYYVDDGVEVFPSKTGPTPGSSYILPGGGGNQYALGGGNQYALGGTGSTTGTGGLGNRYNPFELPSFKPLYDTARSGLEDQYNVAKGNILANTARGGSMNRRLQDLEFNRAGDVGSLVSQTAAPLITDLYNKAYGAAWQTPESSMQGLSQAQQGYSSRLAAANQADQLAASNQKGTMSSLGTLGGLAGKGLAGALGAGTSGSMLAGAGGALAGGLLGLL